jgi:hypothetical protein
VLPTESFSLLQKKLEQLFGANGYRVTWQDSEGDHVTISGDADLREALGLVPAGAPLRIQAASLPLAPSVVSPSLPVLESAASDATASAAAPLEVAGVLNKPDIIQPPLSVIRGLQPNIAAKQVTCTFTPSSKQDGDALPQFDRLHVDEAPPAVAPAAARPETRPPQAPEHTVTPLSPRTHLGVHCHSCGGLVEGRRFKCAVCPNFELCGICEALSYHSEHTMLRLCAPVPGLGLPRGVVAQLFRGPRVDRRVHLAQNTPSEPQDDTTVCPRGRIRRADACSDLKTLAQDLSSLIPPPAQAPIVRDREDSGWRREHRHASHDFKARAPLRFNDHTVIAPSREEAVVYPSGSVLNGEAPCAVPAPPVPVALPYATHYAAVKASRAAPAPAPAEASVPAPAPAPAITRPYVASNTDGSRSRRWAREVAQLRAMGVTADTGVLENFLWCTRGSVPGTLDMLFAQ